MEFLLVPGTTHVSTRAVRCRDYTDSELVSRMSFLKIGRVSARCCWCNGVRNHLTVHVFVGIFTTKKKGGGIYTGLWPTILRRVCYKAPWPRKSWNFLFEKLFAHFSGDVFWSVFCWSPGFGRLLQGHHCLILRNFGDRGSFRYLRSHQSETDGISIGSAYRLQVVQRFPRVHDGWCSVQDHRILYCIPSR